MQNRCNYEKKVSMFIPRQFGITSWVLVISVFWIASASGQDTAPVDQINDFLPYNVTGVVATETTQGSGAVVESRRVVASCAHVVFDDEIWSAAAGWTHENFFYRAWNGVGFPTEDFEQRLRGYVKWNSYASAVLGEDGTSPKAFQDDFVVYYSYTDLFDGTPPSRQQKSISALRSTADKIISGYPGGLYESGDPLEYRLHSTGIFNESLQVELGRYLLADGPSTGPGNSGGPVWVYDESRDAWGFAGVLVSGSEEALGDELDSIGVVGMDTKANRLFDAALKLSTTADSAPEEEVFTSSTDFPVEIPDGDRSGLGVNILATPSGKKVADAALSLKISHPAPEEDIQILLRGPSGKTVVVADRPRSAENGVFEISSRKISGFQNTRASGVWRIIVRDVYGMDVGVVDSLSLTLSTK